MVVDESNDLEKGLCKVISDKARLVKEMTYNFETFNF